MKKDLVLYNRVWPYRIPIFSLLNKEYDLTVSYSVDKEFNEDVDFKVIKLDGKKISRFFIHKDSLHRVCSEFDVVVGYGDIGWLSLMRLLFIRNRPYKIILSGIGVRASYTSGYGEKSVWDKVRYFLMRRADAVLFYSKDPTKLYLNEGFESEKLHVADNTVFVEEIEKEKERDIILFIGTLYKQKRIYELLSSYRQALTENPGIPPLYIIGDGDEYGNIKKWVSENELNDNIQLLGKIFDEKVLCSYFSRSLACISPGQAGLSVLKSMGYGVPFVTKEDAITGGEIFNIENGQNGVIYQEDDELKDIILEIGANNDKFLWMGRNAKNYYDTYRKPEHMAMGIIDAIEHVSQ